MDCLNRLISPLPPHTTRLALPRPLASRPAPPGVAPVALALLSVLVGLAGAAPAAAQGLYRSVDANGRVVFSDRPPSASTPATAARDAAPGAGAGASAALPYELRQVVQRYPVTLYTSSDCEPCASGRQMLLTRGIPFDERTVDGPQDGPALERLSGARSVPLLAIGSQQLKGYSDAEWSQYLDSAGYPKSVSLPPGYRRPPAQPLVAQQDLPAPSATSAAAPARPQTVAPRAPATPTAPNGGPTPANPAGIRF